MTITKQSPPNFPDANWHIVGDIGEPAYANSWVTFGSSYADPAFRMDSDGWVHLRGLAKSGTLDQTIFTLPSGYRPKRNLYVTGLANDAIAYVQILSTGEVSVASPSGSNAYVTLSNVKFPAWSDYSRYDGRIMRLTGPTWEQRTVDSEWNSCLMQHANGMACLMGVQGVITGASTTGVPIGSLQPHYSYVGFMMDGTSTPKRLDISSRYGVYANSTTTTFSVLPSTMFPVKSGVEFSYRSPTLVNSWTSLAFNTSNKHTPIGFYKDPDGFVFLRGLATGGSSASGTIFTLPVGYRPSARLVLASISQAGTCRIDIQSDGTVNAAAGGSTGWNSLDGLCFYADQ